MLDCIHHLAYSRDNTFQKQDGTNKQNKKRKKNTCTLIPQQKSMIDPQYSPVSNGGNESEKRHDRTPKKSHEKQEKDTKKKRDLTRKVPTQRKKKQNTKDPGLKMVHRF